jgi:predicted enzyme related to lactoylglutathione lyase
MATPKKAGSKKAKTQKIYPVVHIEMTVEDRKRMAKFYTKAFGWQMQMLGKDMGNYVLATTAAKVDKKGRPKKTGIINGGFYTKTDDKPAQYPSVVIAVDSIKRSMNKVNKAGGKVIGKPMEIPGFGMYVSFFDTEGNRVSIMEPTTKMKELAKTRN